MNRLENGNLSVGAPGSKMREVYETYDSRFIDAWNNNRLIYGKQENGKIVDVIYPVDLLTFDKKDGVLICWPLNPEFTGKSAISGLLNTQYNISQE